MSIWGPESLVNCLASHSLKKGEAWVIPKNYPTLNGNFKELASNLRIQLFKDINKDDFGGM